MNVRQNRRGSPEVSDGRGSPAGCGVVGREVWVVFDDSSWGRESTFGWLFGLIATSGMRWFRQKRNREWARECLKDMPTFQLGPMYRVIRQSYSVWIQNSYRGWNQLWEDCAQRQKVTSKGEEKQRRGWVLEVISLSTRWRLLCWSREKKRCSHKYKPKRSEKKCKSLTQEMSSVYTKHSTRYISRDIVVIPQKVVCTYW